jgi:pyridoxamine 5'-phosphate oxidase
VSELREQDVDPDPLRQLERWLDEAGREPLPAALATATPDGRPSARMVLVKSVGPDGIAFFTGYESRKGRELAENPRAALLLYWAELGRQVRVEGPVERVPEAESDAYFAARPPGSRVSAAASPQSTVLPDRAALDALVAEVRARYGDDPPRPARWGGFRLVPETYEFWLHHDDRLHDRLRYRREPSGWALERLAP